MQGKGSSADACVFIITGHEGREVLKIKYIWGVAKLVRCPFQIAVATGKACMQYWHGVVHHKQRILSECTRACVKAYWAVQYSCV